jgi:sigma-B regulation protein RsbU (phosphoserine phosphatase)
MARLACYLAGMAGVLFALREILRLANASWGEYLVGWVDFLVFIAASLFSVLAFRWIKRRILWRLRNRLIVTYVFIGVIPVVLLVAMASFSLYLFAGQFATFVVISELNTQLRSVSAANAAISNELAGQMERGGNLSSSSLEGLGACERDFRGRSRLSSVSRQG